MAGPVGRKQCSIPADWGSPEGRAGAKHVLVRRRGAPSGGGGGGRAAATGRAPGSWRRRLSCHRCSSRMSRRWPGLLHRGGGDAGVLNTHSAFVGPPANSTSAVPHQRRERVRRPRPRPRGGQWWLPAPAGGCCLQREIGRGPRRGTAAEKHRTGDGHMASSPRGRVRRMMADDGARSSHVPCPPPLPFPSRGRVITSKNHGS